MTPGAIAAPGPGAHGRAQANRRPLFVALAGALALVVGAVVFVLGHRAASTASDHLAWTRRELRTQQQSTNHARQCHAALTTALPQLVTDAQTLLASASQLQTSDQDAITALHDGQVAGAQGQLTAYNSATGRQNAAATAYNALTATTNQQLTTFRQHSIALPQACP
jgi:hypothetical protein